MNREHWAHKRLETEVDTNLYDWADLSSSASQPQNRIKRLIFGLVQRWSFTGQEGPEN